MNIFTLFGMKNNLAIRAGELELGQLHADNLASNTCKHI